MTMGATTEFNVGEVVNDTFTDGPPHGVILETHDEKGITLKPYDGKSASPYGFYLLYWLRSNGDKPAVVFDPDIPTDIIVLVVGVKASLGKKP